MTADCVKARSLNMADLRYCEAVCGSQEARDVAVGR